jgi:hypothetical protein
LVGTFRAGWSRCDPVNTPIILIQQRIHENDLAAFFLIRVDRDISTQLLLLRRQKPLISGGVASFFCEELLRKASPRFANRWYKAKLGSLCVMQRSINNA